jgi:hypothetical protein
MDRKGLLRIVAPLLLVLGVLAYGGREALASAQFTPCLPPDPPVTMGYCPAGGDPACEAWCQAEFGQEWFGYCTGGDKDCCKCLL